VDPAVSTGGPAAEPASLRWLRPLNALIKTAWAICTWSILGIFTIVVPPVFLVAVAMFAFGLSLMALAGTLYFAILFFCHSRYSLRTLMIAVLVLGLGMSFLVSGNAVLMVVGALMLYALMMEIFFGIQQFDPISDSRPSVGIPPGKEIKV
jgi:hypothetical protein